MIHPRELEILNILWGTDEPLMSIDIISRGHKLSQSTVQAVLRKLLREGLIEAVGSEHSGNAIGRAYRPTEKSRCLVLSQYICQFDAISNIITADDVISVLMDKEGKTKL